MIGAAIDLLKSKEIDDLKAELVSLTIRHNAYGVRAGQYGLAGKVCLAIACQNR
jgi:hypothetical protein